jgi:hypothetical protein
MPEPAGRTSLDGPAGRRASLSGGALLSGVLLGAWVVACDGWVKVLARAGCCDDTRVVGDAAAAVWTVPGACEQLPLVGGVALSPAVRAGTTPMNVAIPEDFADLWGLGLFAIASVVSLVFLMWRRRASGDALAIGTLWAGVAIHGLPRVVGPGTSFSEIAIAGYGVSIGDIALAWAGLWLTWRVLAWLRS